MELVTTHVHLISAPRKEMVMISIGVVKQLPLIIKVHVKKTPQK